MLPRALLACLLALLLAGCAEDLPDAPPVTTPATPGAPQEARVEEAGFVLTGTLDREAIVHGEQASATFHIENTGDDATYETGGCGPAPWVFEILAADGTRVGPVGPDPRCLGPPSTEVTMETGNALDAELRWDGMYRTRDNETGEVRAQPVPPGTYTIRAGMALAREGETHAPAVELHIVVSRG